MHDWRMSADLIAFLNARLDEDEATAKARRGIFPSAAVEDSGAVWLHVKRGGNAVVVHYLHPVEGYGDMADLRAWADAEQGWTQARVLREVEVKREIVTAYEWTAARKADGGGIERNYHFRSGQVNALETAAECLAAVYSDHPDYRPEWKP